ncbi:hypothetical protein A3782_02325 [Bacillus sp. GZT]|nr:hypothetical protein A3782_02325 [Bacillus sp. GZT]
MESRILESIRFYYVNATTARVKPNVFNELEYGPTLTVRVLVIPGGVVKIAGADTEVNPAVYPREVPEPVIELLLRYMVIPAAFPPG